MIYDYPLLLLSAAAPEFRLPAGNQAASQPAWGSGSTFRLLPSFLPFPPPQPHPQLSFVSALYNHLFLLHRTPRPPYALFISPLSLPPLLPPAPSSHSNTPPRTRNAPQVISQAILTSRLNNDLAAARCFESLLPAPTAAAEARALAPQLRASRDCSL